MLDLTLTVTQNVLTAKNTYKIVLESQTVLPQIRGGQFAHLEVPGYLLRRPFCIAQYSSQSITVLYAVIGKGTEALSRVKAGEALKCILPIGNGYTALPSYKKVMLIGGGLGVAPLLPVIKTYPDIEYSAFLGFTSVENVILAEEFKAVAETHIATDDGTAGFKGRVTEMAKTCLDKISPDAIFMCGPTPMIKAVKAWNADIPVFLSMEARMGCGVGACLVCTCPVKRGEVVRNLRVCVDGPVFPLSDIVL